MPRASLCCLASLSVTRAERVLPTHQGFCRGCEKALLTEQIGQQMLLSKSCCVLSAMPIKHLCWRPEEDSEQVLAFHTIDQQTQKVLSR